MKAFAIKDDTVSKSRELAYLLYYEMPRMFFIEISEQTTEWEAPLLLSSFVKGEILRKNGLKEYDEFSLLELSGGKCAQDECYIEPVSEDEVYEKMQDRFGKKVKNAVPLENYDILLFLKMIWLKNAV